MITNKNDWQSQRAKDICLWRSGRPWTERTTCSFDDIEAYLALGLTVSSGAILKETVQISDYVVITGLRQINKSHNMRELRTDGVFSAAGCKMRAHWFRKLEES
jgi:hypothetical protein